MSWRKFIDLEILRFAQDDVKRVQDDNPGVIASVQRNVAIASNRDLREQNTECAVRRSNDAVGAAFINSNVRFSFFGSFSFFLHHAKKKEMNNKKRDCFATLAMTCEKYRKSISLKWLCHLAMTGKRSFAFTLSEVLIVLAVLGVIAAMTIPDLVQDYQKKATATQVKKVYSTLNQVVTASSAENGPASNYFSANNTVDADTTKKFFETYWLPYFRVQKIADDGKTFYDDRTPYSFLNGTQLTTLIITQYYGARVLFSDASGTIYFIYIAGYVDGVEQYTSTQRVYVDINGVKGPNTFGKDVFVFLVDINDSVVNPYGYNVSKNTIKSNCSSSGSGRYCAAKIKRDGWKIADDYPW